MASTIDSLVKNNSQFFFAKVVASDPGAYTVQVAPMAGRSPSLLSGRVLSSSMANLFGVKNCMLPQPGDTVFCFKLDAYSCVVMGTIPETTALDLPETMPVRSCIGAGDGNSNEYSSSGHDTDMSKSLIQNNLRPTDIVDGEWAMSNEFGNLVGLFHGFSVLKASELSQVQCFILDDLTRIIGHNLEHISCMGESKISQEGTQLNMEFSYTDDPIEAQGIPNVDGQNKGKASITFNGETSNDDSKDFFSLVDEKLTSISRLKGFVGALGDFIHLILSVPDKELPRVMDGKTTEIYDKGLASFKVNADGFISARSLMGISLEKTNWIRVPQRITSVEAGELSKKVFCDPFIFDPAVQASGQPYLYFLQLRDYLAYVQEEAAYKQLKASGKFEINDDPTFDQDIDQVNEYNMAFYEKKTAGIYLMPNGGISLIDAWGSSLVMEGGNIFIQPAKDLVAQPLRHLIGKVGGNVSVAAKDDIELSSTNGGYRLKTDKSQYNYSATSGILLHSDATGPSEAQPVEGVITNLGGILLHAPKAAVTTHGKYSLIKADELLAIKADTAALDTDSRFLLRCEKGVDLFTNGEMLISAKSQLNLFTEGQALLVGASATFVGAEKQTVAITPLGPAQGLIKLSAFDKYREQIDRILKEDFQHFSPVYAHDDSFDALKFRFPTSDQYKVNIAEDLIPQTIAQQADASLNLGALKSWVENAVNDTYPYPGKEKRQNYAMAALNNLAIDPVKDDLYNKAVNNEVSATITYGDIFTDYKVK